MRFCKKIGGKRRIAALLCLVIAVLTAAAPLNTGLTAGAATLSEQLQDARNKSQAAKDKIAALKEQNAPNEEKRAALQAQMDALAAEIDLYDSQISECDAQIAEKEEEIAQKEAELEENKDLFKRRLVAMYTSGSSNALDVLLSAEDFGDYLAKTELMRSVTEHDTQLMEKIKDAIEAITSAKQEIEDTKAEKESLRKDVLSRQEEVEASYQELKKIIDEINSSIASQERIKNEADQKEKEIQREIEAANQAASNGSSGGGQIVQGTGRFIWPLPGYSVSSPFAWRWGKQHKGVDISGNASVWYKPILAADSGTVTYVCNDGPNTWGGGYGIHVMIRHDDTYTTLYAHMSSTDMYVGKTVKQGDVIGKVGSTGHSTGAHLHFEVRVNGTPVDPMQFF